MTIPECAFDIPLNHVVVTTSYITNQGMAVRYVSHTVDADGDVTWQFHANNGDYSSSVLQLVSLRQILELDPKLAEISSLPMGFSARRSSASSPWVIEREEAV